MFRPRMCAPMFSNPFAAKSLSTPSSPPFPPCISRHTRVGKNHSISSGPVVPRGCLRLWSGPAPNPSMDIPNDSTRSRLVEVGIDARPPAEEQQQVSDQLGGDEEGAAYPPRPGWRSVSRQEPPRPQRSSIQGGASHEPSRQPRPHPELRGRDLRREHVPAEEVHEVTAEGEPERHQRDDGDQPGSVLNQPDSDPDGQGEADGATESDRPGLGVFHEWDEDNPQHVTGAAGSFAPDRPRGDFRVSSGGVLRSARYRAPIVVPEAAGSFAPRAIARSAQDDSAFLGIEKRIKDDGPNDLARRVEEHKQGLLRGFTSQFHVTRLVHFEEFIDIRDAIAREKELKGWRRSRKIELIERQNLAWQDLAE